MVHGTLKLGDPDLAFRSFPDCAGSWYRMWWATLGRLARRKCTCTSVCLCVFYFYFCIMLLLIFESSSHRCCLVCLPRCSDCLICSAESHGYMVTCSIGVAGGWKGRLVRRSTDLNSITLSLKNLQQHQTNCMHSPTALLAGMGGIWGLAVGGNQASIRRKYPSLPIAVDWISVI